MRASIIRHCFRIFQDKASGTGFKSGRSLKGLVGIAFFSILAAGSVSFAYLGSDYSISDSPSAPRRLIVKVVSDIKISPSVSKRGTAEVGLANFDKLSDKFRVRSFSPLCRNSKRVTLAERFRHVYLLTVDEGTDIDAMKAEYERLSEVEYAEPDYPVDFHGFYDDPYYSHQWGHNNTGQGHYHIARQPGPENDKMMISYGLAEADVDADEVFVNPPDNTVTAIVAIIDTGVDTDHPDLAENIWVNPFEIPGNNVDDDNNGYIDDVHGWDFSASGDFLEIALEDNDPTDEFGHGTHCAGIVAASAGNGIGIVGVSGVCRIMALKIMPVPLTSKIARAIIYAAENGADVINMSFGMPYRSYLLEEALDYARAKGVIACASSGNSGIEEYNYPAAFESTIAVGATNDSDRVTTFSTFGEHIDVCAPGLSIISLRADSTDMYDESEPGVHIISNHYYLASGTSMSSPCVAGVAGYIRSVSPGLSPLKTQEIIQLSAYDFEDPYGMGWFKFGWDKYSGYGRVNLNDALNLTPSIRAVIESPRPFEIVSGQTEIIGIADGEEFSSYVVEYGQGGNPSSWTQINASSTPVTDNVLALWNKPGLCGLYTVRLRAGEDNFSSRLVFVANEAKARIIYPAPGDTVSNIVDIVADAYSPDFSHSVLEYGYGPEPVQWTEISALSVPVSGGVISDWMAETVPEGEYVLRLSVYSESKLEIAHEVQIFVRSNFSLDNAWKVDLGSDASIIANYGDIDNDGVREIIVGTSSGIKIFSPDGTPETGSLPALVENSFFVPIAVGNLDGDGIDDIVAVGSAPPMLYGFPSNGLEFEVALGISIDPSRYSDEEHDFPKLFLKDIDNDGRDEIHLVIAGNGASRALAYESDGTPLFSLPLASEYLPADLNRDGVDELYVYSDEDSFLRQFDLSLNTLDSFYAEIDENRFQCRGLSAFDIDGDGRLELTAFGHHESKGFWLYVFNDGLNLKTGWPHNLAIDDYLVPTVPVFGDINGDGVPEYMCTYFDVSVSYVHVWNLDGTSFIAGNPNGLFATISRPGVLNMPVLADVDGDEEADILACANDDLFFTYRVQRIYAWNTSGEVQTGFPFITVPELPLHYYSSFRFVPTSGDINGDGYLDMVMPTGDSSLIFVNFPGTLYDPCCSWAPLWRYNRRLNNNGTGPVDCSPTDVEDQEISLPERFALSQNYPNPFNPVTRIEYSLASRSHVKITVNNVLGQKLAVLLDEEMPAGRHRIFWNGADDRGFPLPSGMYLYRIVSGDFVDARKMLLIK